MAKFPALNGETSGELVSRPTPSPLEGRTGESKAPEGSILRIVDIISEGPIVGLTNVGNYNKSVFINDVPLTGNDNTDNYNGVAWSLLSGYPTQQAPSGHGVVESTHAVGREIQNGTPVVIRVRGRGVDAVRLSVRFPSLFSQQDDGSTRATYVQFKFEIKLASSAEYTTYGDVSYAYKSTSAFERNYRVNFADVRTDGVSLADTVDEDIDIRVSRLDARSTDVKTQKLSFLASYTSLTEIPIAYANTAYCAMEIDAEQFASSATKRTYDITGIMVEVPSNYNPKSHTYKTRIWDGKFKSFFDWTDNPAWLLYALLTNPRYGLGDVLSNDQINKWSFYEAAKYNDEKVDNGRGGLEPRFTYNGVITARKSAYDILNEVASSFRAKIIWSAGQVSLIQDKPGFVKEIITAANVENGAFQYASSGGSSRHTAVRVAWINPEDGWRPNYEIIENNKAIQRYGWKQLDVNGYGITTRAQARRYGLWLLYTELNEKQIVSYSTGLDQVATQPGDIIALTDTITGSSEDVADLVSGRMLYVDAETQEVQFDKTITSYASPTSNDGRGAYKFIWVATFGGNEPILFLELLSSRVDDEGRMLWKVRGKHPTVIEGQNLNDRRNYNYFLNENEAQTTSSLANIGAGSVYSTFTAPYKERDESYRQNDARGVGNILGVLDLAPYRLWRVIDVAETEPGKVTVSALEYYDKKYERVDTLAAKFEIDTQVNPLGLELSTATVDADSITLEPYIYRVKDIVNEAATLSWEPLNDPSIIYYIPEIANERVDSGRTDLDGEIVYDYAWEAQETTPLSSLILSNFEESEYFVRVRWRDTSGRFGKYSGIKRFDKPLFLGNPSNIEKFILTITRGVALFTWSALREFDLAYYQIRYAVQDIGWENAEVIEGSERIQDSNFQTSIRRGYFYIKAFDVAGNESLNAISLFNKIHGREGGVAAELFRPSSAATDDDADEIMDLMELGSQAEGTIVRDWQGTASRLHRDPTRSFYYVGDQREVSGFTPPPINTELSTQFTTTINGVEGEGTDFTGYIYPRAPLDILTYDSSLPYGNSDATPVRDVSEVHTDALEATNGEVINGVLYSEPFAVMTNWDNLNFDESICVYKAQRNLSTFIPGGVSDFNSYPIYGDTHIMLRFVRIIDEGNFLYSLRGGGLGVIPSNKMGLAVSRDKRPEEFIPLFTKAVDSDGAAQTEDPEGYVDMRNIDTERWEENTNNLLISGNKGYNRELNISLPIVDFGAPTEFKFTAEIDWEAELSDNITDYPNRIPDVLTQGVITPIQFLNAVRGGDSEFTPFETTTVQAVRNWLDAKTKCSLKMNFIDTSVVSEQGADPFGTQTPFYRAPKVNEFFRESLNIKSGRIAEWRTSSNNSQGTPYFFTSNGTHRATCVWPELTFTMPTGIYTLDCSLFRVLIRSLILRFDVDDRVESRKGIIYNPNDNTDNDGWLKVSYNPSYIRIPTLIIDTVNLLESEQKEIRNSTNKGFEIRFVNSSGTNISKNFDYIARGFGYELKRTTEFENPRRRRVIDA